MNDLWPHQAETLDEKLPAAFKAGHKRVCLYGPCGSGKTTIIAEFCRRAASKGNSVTVTAHRRRLIKQLAERLKKWGIRYSIEMATLPDEPWAVVDEGADIVIGSRDTMLTRLNKIRVMRTKIWVPDEAHCIAGRGYKELGDAINPEFVLGPTATPCCQDGSGFGRNLFTTLVYSTTVEGLIRDGLLVPVEAYAPVGAAKRRTNGMKNGIYGDPVRQWIKHAEGLRTVSFCRTLKECRDVTRLYLENMIPAEHIDADSDDSVRDAAIVKLATGEIKVLVCTPGLMGVGVDIPEIECVQTLVKNISPIPYWQSIGRGQRIAQGKKRAVLLDHSAAVYEHGMPNVSPKWELGEGDSVQVRQVKRMESQEDMRPVVCPACGCYSTGGRCHNCNTVTVERRGRAVKTERENLEHVDGVDSMSRFQIHWRQTLFSCARMGSKVVVAIMRFRQKWGKWPWELDVDPVAHWGMKDRLVVQQWPMFGAKS